MDEQRTANGYDVYRQADGTEYMVPVSDEEIRATLLALMAANGGEPLEVEMVEPEPEHPTQEQRHLWANARTAHALLSGAPYVYLTDPNAAHDDDVWGDLILIAWRGQEIVCPVPVVVDMLHPDPYMWYGESATIPDLIGYAPVEYRERTWE